MILTHCPFEPTPDSKDWDPKSKGSPSYKGKAQYFGDMVRYMDKMVGKILKKLDDEGLRENTLVVFVGDNGTDTPVVSMMNGRKVAGAKGKMHDGGNRVPCIASWPGTIPAGQVSREILDFSDFLPTFCEIGECPTPTNVDGRSLLKTLKGSDAKHRDWIYMWYSRNGGNKQARAFSRNQRYKLYDDGQFFDVKNDVLEKSPLKGKLTDEEKVNQVLLLDARVVQLDVRVLHLDVRVRCGGDGDMGHRLNCGGRLLSFWHKMRRHGMRIRARIRHAKMYLCDSIDIRIRNYIREFDQFG